MPVTGAVEGVVDEVVMRRVAAHLGIDVTTIYVTDGAGSLFRRLNGFNAAAEHSPWFVVADLDSIPCPPTLIRERIPAPAAQMVFRVAVRSIESWLMADRSGLAGFLGVAQARVPADPDGEADPKQTMVNIARRSRRRAIRDDMAPPAAGRRRVGPAYESRLIEFVTAHAQGWDPDRAIERSESFRRCVDALRRLGG